MTISMRSIMVVTWIVDGLMFDNIPVRAHVRARCASEAVNLVIREARAIGADIIVQRVERETIDTVGCSEQLMTASQLRSYAVDHAEEMAS